MKNALRMIPLCVITSLFFLVLEILANGIPLFGLPDAADVEQVTIVYTKEPDNVKTFTDEYNISLAVALLCFTRYDPLKSSPVGEPTFEITYHLHDSRTCVISANENAV